MTEFQQASKEILDLKNCYTQKSKKNYVIKEIIPKHSWKKSIIDEENLRGLQKFCDNNIIYSTKNDLNVCDTECIEYLGDINNFWLSAKKHDTNYQPFFPTWVLTAFLLSFYAKEKGFEETIDIGSGDGRLSYCSKLIRLQSYSIEIDEDLCLLQQDICNKTKIKYEILNEDATKFDFHTIDFKFPLFFISGLPELGDMIASKIISNIRNSNIKEQCGISFIANPLTKKYSENDYWGWKEILHKNKLYVDEVFMLPSHWTTDVNTGTLYIFTKFMN